MSNIYFEQIAAPITLNEYEMFEKKINKALPDEFKNFYLTNNGGVPLQYIYWSDAVIYIIDRFIPVFHGEMTVESIYINMLNDGSVTSDFIPFALEESGGLFLVSLEEKSFGNIFFGDHECVNIDKPYDNIFYVENSLSSFLSKLTDQHPE